MTSPSRCSYKTFVPHLDRCIRVNTELSDWNYLGAACAPKPGCGLVDSLYKKMNGAESSQLSSKTAPSYPLPQIQFYSVEYPGYISQGSGSQAVIRLGGQNALDTAFKRLASHKGAFLELNLRPGDTFSHPIPGDVVGTSNLLLKITKRKYRCTSDDSLEQRGKYTTRIIGYLPKTIRFRSMADYQFQPDLEDRLTGLQRAMEQMDVASIIGYKIPLEEEDYYSSLDADSTSRKGNLRIFPPPLFGRQTIAQAYNYKQNPTSMETTVVNQITGEERRRLINKQRWKGWAPTSISFGEATPELPPQNAQIEAANADKDILEKLKQAFLVRPVWTRNALYNQFTTQEVREISNSKYIMPLICYVFQDGPWRDTFVRLGYDPRSHKDARIYQRIYFRNVNHNVERASIITRRQDSRREVLDKIKEVRSDAMEEHQTSRSHIFDGRTLMTDIAAFQLCDIHDVLLRNMIDDEKSLRDSCHERDGWYTSESLERIKMVLRHKFFNLLEGIVVSDEECEALLLPLDNITTPMRPRPLLRPGKHNMAKGALPPEEVTAVRLRSVLEGNSKSSGHVI